MGADTTRIQSGISSRSAEPEERCAHERNGGAPGRSINLVVNARTLCCSRNFRQARRPDHRDPSGDGRAYTAAREPRARILEGQRRSSPRTAQVYGKEVQTVEINFLCVHKKLRSKRLAPVLIKEVTRRINHTGVFQAVYTAGVVRAGDPSHSRVSTRPSPSVPLHIQPQVLPKPVAKCRYFHRSLDPKKVERVVTSASRFFLASVRFRPYLSSSRLDSHASCRG